MRGIFGSMFGGGAVNAAGSQTLRLTDPLDRWFGPGAQTNSGKYVGAESAMRVSAVYGCVNLLAKTVASLPLTMYRITDPVKGSVVAEPRHPLNDLLEHQPNKWQTAWDFKAMMQMHLVLRGNAYAEIVAGPRGFADQLEPLHPDNVWPELLDNGVIRYKIIDRFGKSRVLLQEEMMHIRAPIQNGITGLSPISYARETIGLALATEEHGARQFSNGARPSGIVTLDGTLSDEGFERFKTQFNAAYSGLAKAGSTPILESGAKFEAISMTAEDAQFIASREFQIEEIARWFDVPLVLLHHMTKTSSWGTGVEAIMLAFVRNNLRPWLAAWTNVIRRDLIIAPQLYQARFDVEDLQSGDSKSKAEFFSKLVQAGILTRNEARESLGYNSLSGLDEPLAPVNLAPANAPDPGTGNAAEHIDLTAPEN